MLVLICCIPERASFSSIHLSSSYFHHMVSSCQSYIPSYSTPPCPPHPHSFPDFSLCVPRFLDTLDSLSIQPRTGQQASPSYSRLSYLKWNFSFSCPFVHSTTLLTSLPLSSARVSPTSTIPYHLYCESIALPFSACASFAPHSLSYKSPHSLWIIHTHSLTTSSSLFTPPPHILLSPSFFL